MDCKPHSLTLQFASDAPQGLAYSSRQRRRSSLNLYANFVVCVVPCTSDTYELHWRAENNKCYFVSKKKENYDTARSNCQKYDYDLVSFTDEQEKDFVLSKSKYEFIQIISFCH